MNPIEEVPGYYRQRVGAYRWNVLDGALQQIASVGSTISAVAAAERHRRISALRARKCLCCETQFMSEGAHNRLCDKCRESVVQW